MLSASLVARRAVTRRRDVAGVLSLSRKQGRMYVPQSGLQDEKNQVELTEYVLYCRHQVLSWVISAMSAMLLLLVCP